MESEKTLESGETRLNAGSTAEQMECEDAVDESESLARPEPELPLKAPENELQPNDTNAISVRDIIIPEVQPAVAEMEHADDPETSGSSAYYLSKSCVNSNCPKQDTRYVLADGSTLRYYDIAKKLNGKRQYVCVECHEVSLRFYEGFCGSMLNKKPILLKQIRNERSDLLKIDSSDDEADNETITNDDDFLEEELEMLENEMKDAIASVYRKVDIQAHLSWCMSDINARILKNQELSQSTLDDMNIQSRKLSEMSKALSSLAPYTIKHIRPIEISPEAANANIKMPANSNVNLPPTGPVEFPPVQLYKLYYAAKNQVMSSWVLAKVFEIVPSATGKMYKLKCVSSTATFCKVPSGKALAYNDPPSVQLPVGSRVIAFFDDVKATRGKSVYVSDNAFYPGVVAETLKASNRYRYLIFYDDGYVQYVQHKDVRLVCECSPNVWEDVDAGSRDFIRNYLEQFEVNRPMVYAQRSQTMNVERNGMWLVGRVLDIDSSLLLIQFEGQRNSVEWIYRGSLRLGPVFKEHQKMLQNKTKPPALQHRVARRAEPFIMYSNNIEAAAAARKIATVERHAPPLNRNDSQPPTIKHLNNSVIYVDDDATPRGQVTYFSAKRNLPPKKYEPHECKPSCLFKVTNKMDKQAHLAKPLLSGWERGLMSNKQGTQKNIVYRAPCGRSMRCMEDVRIYLRATNSTLNVNNFDFSSNVHCLSEYTVNNPIVVVEDISCGLENIPIPLVNYYDNTLPPKCTYAAQRIPTEGVHLNLDEEFLCGCDCEDDCSDKNKCACWRLTAEGALRIDSGTVPEEVGYTYKRLLAQVRSGIYECNSRCKCKANCLNRVVQQPLEVKLQVFKTSNRGWGLRCLNDVSKGTFICIYAGFLLTEANANEGGRESGDEYFADLDYIENTEPLKEGYESDVEHSVGEEDDAYEPEPEDDDEFHPSKNSHSRSKNRSRQIGGSADPTERQRRNFNPNTDMDVDMIEEKSIRRFFGENESVYIMDAKHTGNIGRYFNHSCNPNLFVQNVFVDTHDPRFPWVAFFADMDIVAGTELTWNYSYEVGVVPGKVLYCQCGSANCRQRLL